MILLAVVLWRMASGTSQSVKEEDSNYTNFLAKLDQGQVKEVTILLSPNSAELKGDYRDGGKFRNVTIANTAIPDITKTLQEKGVRYNYAEVKNADWLTFIVNFAPLMLLVAFWIFMMKQMQAGGNKALSFGKSRARLLTAQQKKATFKDVAGIDEPKEELYEIIDFLKDPQKFQKLGGRIPKGVLLVGPPGTGKTLLARAIAGEANVPFFSISGSDFVEMFVGVGASRVRDLFEQGKKNAPCIVFIDEIDAVGRHRGAGLGGGHDEREQTLNQLLVEMDGFESNEGVILVAATNRPDVLDPALLRPGRFDRRIVVNRPDVKGREGILGVHTREKPLRDVDLGLIAQQTSGLTGADLANICNEAAIFAARRRAKSIGPADFDGALERVIAGVQSHRVLNAHEKRVVAYHEAGHALCGELLPSVDRVHRISIVPRGRALGYTLNLPAEDRYLKTREELLDYMTCLLGGRVAEEVVFGAITTGASDDLRRVADISHSMVHDYAMGNAHVGRSPDGGVQLSQTTLRIRDEERQDLIEEARRAAQKLIQAHRVQLDALAQELLSHEVLDRAAIDRVMAGVPRLQRTPGIGLRIAAATPLEVADGAPPTSLTQPARVDTGDSAHGTRQGAEPGGDPV